MLQNKIFRHLPFHEILEILKKFIVFGKESGFSSPTSRSSLSDDPLNSTRPSKGFLLLYVKHWERICSGRGRHLISINFPPRNWEGSYAYLFKINFASCFMIGEAHGWGIFPK